MGFLYEPKSLSLNPSFLFQASAKSTSRPSKSTRAEVGRPARSTDVHDVHALTWQMAGRPTESTGTESSALCSFGSTGAADRRLQRSDS